MHFGEYSPISIIVFPSWAEKLPHYWIKTVFYGNTVENCFLHNSYLGKFLVAKSSGIHFT